MLRNSVENPDDSDSRAEYDRLLQRYAALRFEAILNGQKSDQIAADAAWAEVEDYLKEHPYRRPKP